MSETESVDYPEVFVVYTKQNLATDKEYIKHTVKHGSILLQGRAQMIVAAKCEKSCRDSRTAAGDM